jgi:hypothetical protein
MYRKFPGISLQHFARKLSPCRRYNKSMNSKVFTQIMIVSGGLCVLAGCNDEPESHMVSAPPPATPTASQPVVVATPGAAPAVGNNTIVVTQAPPAPQAENPHEQPSSEYVWVPGYWSWRNDQYAWIAGQWEIPPHGNTTWIPPYWEQEGNGYRFYEGYWK